MTGGEVRAIFFCPLEKEIIKVYCGMPLVMAHNVTNEIKKRNTLRKMYLLQLQMNLFNLFLIYFFK